MPKAKKIWNILLKQNKELLGLSMLSLSAVAVIPTKIMKKKLPPKSQNKYWYYGGYPK
jgi:hypothetical protein